jgi:hypothetical protein
MNYYRFKERNSSPDPQDHVDCPHCIYSGYNNNAVDEAIDEIKELAKDKEYEDDEIICKCNKLIDDDNIEEFISYYEEVFDKINRCHWCG